MDIKQGQTKVIFDKYSSDFLSADMGVEEKKRISIGIKINVDENGVNKYMELIITDTELTVNNTTTVLIPLEMSNQFLTLFQEIQIQLNKMEIALPEPPPENPPEEPPIE